MGTRTDEGFKVAVAPVRYHLAFGYRDRVALRMPEDTPVV